MGHKADKLDLSGKLSDPVRRNILAALMRAQNPLTMLEISDHMDGASMAACENSEVLLEVEVRNCLADLRAKGIVDIQFFSVYDADNEPRYFINPLQKLAAI
jgi:hypothetical protein